MLHGVTAWTIDGQQWLSDVTIEELLCSYYFLKKKILLYMTLRYHIHILFKNYF